MKILELLEDARMGQEMAYDVENLLKQAGWTQSMEDVPKGATYTTRRGQNGGMVFMVSVVNSRDGREEQGQLSGKVLNNIINPPYREARQSGVSFTQPVGMPNTGWENEKVHGSVIQFQVG
jgi:hypothetical protein